MTDHYFTARCHVGDSYADYAVASLSVRLSVTFRYYVKTDEHIVEILSLPSAYWPHLFSFYEPNRVPIFRQRLRSSSSDDLLVPTRGVHGSGKPHGNPIPMGIPWVWE